MRPAATNPGLASHCQADDECSGDAGDGDERLTVHDRMRDPSAVMRWQLVGRLTSRSRMKARASLHPEAKP